MEQGQQRQPILGVSAAQISPGALASVTAAVVASYFGVGGTLIGAAITSVVATLGGARYRQSIERAQARVLIRRNPRTGAVTRKIVPPAADQSSCQLRLHWISIIAAIILVFALALGSITAVETLARRPVASLLGRVEADSGKTSLGVVMQEVSDPAPQAEPTTIPGVGESPTAEVLATATPAATTIVAPGGAPMRTTVARPTVAPTVPTPTPMVAPTAGPGAPTATVTTPAVPARPAATPVVP